MNGCAALDNIRLKPCERWGHTEYSLPYHRDYMAKLAGRAPDHPGWLARAYDALGMDFIWHVQDGLTDWARTGRVTNMGHASYAADGSDCRASAVSPFSDPEEVWAFDAVTEYGLPDFDEQVHAYEKHIQEQRAAYPHQLVTGGYYKSIVSGAIEAFGWDMLLMAASDQKRMERVLDSFFQRTLFHMRAWAGTSAEVLIQHDDFVWTAGAFMHPDFYRKAIVPRYAELWKPVHEAGKKVLFCSDGDFTEFAEDVAAAGADGFIFEPCVDFGVMVEKFGRSHCLAGSYVDCRDLTFGHWDDTLRALDRTFEKMADCRGAIFAVGNHLPANIPEATLERFFEALLPRLKK
jgi:hypothetical protein